MLMVVPVLLTPPVPNLTESVVDGAGPSHHHTPTGGCVSVRASGCSGALPVHQ
jgi:hypothetical protein